MPQPNWLEPELMRLERETAVLAERRGELAHLLATDWPRFERQLEALCRGEGAEAPFTIFHDHLLYHGAYLVRLTGRHPQRLVPCALTWQVNQMVGSKLGRRGWTRRLLPDPVAFEYSCDALTTVVAEYVRMSA